MLTRVRPRAYLGCAVLTGVLATTSACTSTSPTSPTSSPADITQERAIDIARQQVTFIPTSVDVAADTVRGQATWAVVFRASDGTHGGLGQFMKVWVDRHTGEIVGVARS